MVAPQVCDTRPMTGACVFCQVVAGDLPSSRVHETSTVAAFMDIHPVTPGHLLVVPKAHVVGLAELSDELAAEMVSVARRLGAALRRSELRCEGVNLFLADGVAAGQEVFHAHLHVIPRFAGDGFVLDVRRGPDPSRRRLDDHAAQLRATFE
jgi:histidine triad (HIT) family protein